VDEAERQADLAAVQREIAGCMSCVAAGFILAARPVFRGHAGLRLMVVGQAPGAASHAASIPYSGVTGRTLAGWLERAGLPPGALHERFYLTSLTKCFPGKASGGKGDRAPSAREVALCGRHLAREIALVRPEVVVSLGRLAANALCAQTRRLPLADIVGRAWPGEYGGMRFTLVPLPHPSGVSRWLNDAENQARVDAALAALGDLVAGER
jgi:uracil-DNA glycosylase family 4